MNSDAKVNNQIKRNDFAIIIACNRQLASFAPVRLVYTGASYAAGLVLGRVTASGYYAAYNDSNSDGTQTAVGVLNEDVSIDDISTSSPSGAASGTSLARMIVGGEVFQAKLTGLDNAAIVDLKARSITDASGVQVLKF